MTGDPLTLETDDERELWRAVFAQCATGLEAYLSTCEESADAAVLAYRERLPKRAIVLYSSGEVQADGGVRVPAEGPADAHDDPRLVLTSHDLGGGEASETLTRLVDDTRQGIIERQQTLADSLRERISTLEGALHDADADLVKLRVRVWTVLKGFERDPVFDAMVEALRVAMREGA